MKSVLTLALLPALVALTAASAPKSSDQQALMDEIELKVRLPVGAERLTAYGRYYAFDGKGKVEARYLLPLGPATPDPLPADWGCEELLELGNEPVSRPVPCPRDPDMGRYLKAGQRRWFADFKAIPMIFDGGCMVVHVTFDLKTRKVEHVSCNGHA
jgi:hypothetical protein